MPAKLLDGLLISFSLWVLLKFAFFFVLSYPVRRKALDRSYGDQASATTNTDPLLLAISMGLFGVLLWRGPDYASFLSGLLIGATLLQVYFHRFSEPLSEQEAPKPPLSPIKLMSYAIQARPSRPWLELVLIAALVVWSVTGIIRG